MEPPLSLVYFADSNVNFFIQRNIPELPRYLKVLTLSSDSWCKVVSIWCKLIKHFSQCHDRLSGQINLKLWRINQAMAAVSILHWPWEHNHQRGLPGEDAEEVLFGTEMMKIQDYFMEVLIPEGSVLSTLERTCRDGIMKEKNELPKPLWVSDALKESPKNLERHILNFSCSCFLAMIINKMLLPGLKWHCSSVIFSSERVMSVGNDPQYSSLSLSWIFHDKSEIPL